jgi:multicomponent Na+:H+ antiporter subunit C
MALITAILVGSLFTVGVYLILRKHLIEVLFGLLLLSQATNLMIVAAGGWEPDRHPPILVEEPRAVEAPDGSPAKVMDVNVAQYVDPVPHALVLTAIVIGFGLLSFLMVLVSRTYEASYDSQKSEEEMFGLAEEPDPSAESEGHAALGDRRDIPPEVTASEDEDPDGAAADTPSDIGRGGDDD